MSFAGFCGSARDREAKLELLLVRGIHQSPLGRIMRAILEMIEDNDLCGALHRGTSSSADLLRGHWPIQAQRVRPFAAMRVPHWNA